MSAKLVTLDKPVTAHGEEVTFFSLTEPTVEDVMELGYPFLVVSGADDESGIELRPKIVAKYVVRLAKVPMSSVKAMTLDDLSRCQAVVMGFFGKGDGDKAAPPEP